MAKQGQTSGPLHLSSLDLQLLNRLLAQIRDELDELKGLRGGKTVYDDLTIEGNLTVNGSVTTGSSSRRNSST